MNRKKNLLAFVFSEVVLPVVILVLSVTFVAQFLALTSRALPLPIAEMTNTSGMPTETMAPASLDTPSWKHAEALPPIARR